MLLSNTLARKQNPIRGKAPVQGRVSQSDGKHSRLSFAFGTSEPGDGREDNYEDQTDE